ncbi:hypothetical protein BJX66DRAFT_344895 [Aspergillus keveii]|uniref:DUF7924 domain-containing protein n=1 Tax=Aspergillus keveii TaxID=714993 RepID=A0ABR4FKC6_9EURO
MGMQINALSGIDLTEVLSGSLVRHIDCHSSQWQPAKRSSEMSAADGSDTGAMEMEMTQLGDAIQQSIRKDGWPDNLFQLGPDDALRLFADRTRTRTRSTLPAEQAGSPYLSQECDRFLQVSMKINPDDHKDGPAAEDIATYSRLFKTSDWETPTGSIFDDKEFLYICNLHRNDGDGDAAVKAMIGCLIGPLACVEIVRGRVPFKGLIDGMMMRWEGEGEGEDKGPIARLDDGQFRLPLDKLQPFLDDGREGSSYFKGAERMLLPFLDDGREGSSYFKGAERMLLPFLTAEANCDEQVLQWVERKNMQSMGRALTGVVELFKLAKREKDLHRRILGFSVSYNSSIACVHAYYPIVTKKTSTSEVKASYHRREISRVVWATDSDKDRWTIYHFILTLYRDWVPKHYELLCSAINALPEPGK